ncbi:DNA polymerase III subunit delta [Cerasicoccus maritimus]|uniref:DNA polymerase III subunit delta n=1 Tax=Cerasicoccus maritimus TaxID=490089 RepID=UPI002852A817|nr:DNA polymerase III subunit delta [Cerasicoccus maritimus]
MKPFTFICGDDDFLVTREGQAVFAEKAKDITDDFSKETIDGAAQNMGDVETALNQFRAATQTLSMFGDKKVVWLKDVSFFADSVTGRAEGTKKLVTEWQEELAKLDPSAVDVLITAHPVDRRRKEFKWFSKNSEYTDLKSGSNDDFLLDLVFTESKRLKTTFTTGASQALIGLVGGNTRLVLEETRKLCTYVGEEGEVTDEIVIQMVPHFGEGDFFEPVEAFFSLDLNWTLDALRRYFFIHKEARPLIVNLQGRNRLMIQLRVLMDSGEITLGPRGFSKPTFEAAQRKYAQHFGGFDDKSNFNVFTQNLWYLGNKVAPPCRQLKLKQLVDFQVSFTKAFEDLMRKPQDQDAVMRDLAIACLG